MCRPQPESPQLGIRDLWMMVNRLELCVVHRTLILWWLCRSRSHVGSISVSQQIAGQMMSDSTDADGIAGRALSQSRGWLDPGQIGSWARASLPTSPRGRRADVNTHTHSLFWTYVLCRPCSTLLICIFLLKFWRGVVQELGSVIGHYVKKAWEIIKASQ